MNLTKNIFAICTGQDKGELQNLLRHLQSIEKDYHTAIWSNDAIDDKQQWEPIDVERLNHTDVFLLLLSNAFMNSEFVENDEFRTIIDRYKKGEAKLIPILLDDCSWKNEFTFSHYNFNFGEVQIFRKDAISIGEWNPTDKVFTQVVYFLMGLLSSSIKKSIATVSTDEQGILNLGGEGQMAIDFGEEIVDDNKANRESAFTKKVEAKRKVESENRLHEEAEVKEQLRKEKWLRQKAENQSRIEKEIQAKKIVQEEIQESELEKARIEIEAKRREQVLNALKEAARKKRHEEAVNAPKRVLIGSGLAKYNYRFNNEKEAPALSVVKEERFVTKELKTQVAVVEKREREVIAPLKEIQQPKKQEETVLVDQTVTRKSDLAKYNYRFDSKNKVEVVEVVREETRLNEEPETQLAVEDKKWDTIVKTLRELEWDKKLHEKFVALKNAATVLFAKSIHFFNKKLKVEPQNIQEERTSNEKLKVWLAVGEKKWDAIVKSSREAEWDKKLYKKFAVLKSVTKSYFFAVKGFAIKSIAAINQFFQKIIKNIGANKKRKIRSEFLIAAVVIFGVLTYLFVGGSEKQSYTLSEVEEVKEVSDASVSPESNQENRTAANLEIEDSAKEPSSLVKNKEVKVVSDAGAGTINKKENRAGGTLKLGVGDMHNEGVIFAIDPSSNTGKIAYLEDKGPMAWKDAMNIHEQLGEGWRLPELDELRLLYKTIGQGADNKGKFVAELYWSATPFDKHQARLVKFSDGNASYHYNSSGTHRKFRVRAIKDVQL
ncbi:hypothetical protein [Zobellia sp. 1_MG-2023]|uniref:hypothetical protein n=1 Tax=Zobellia sp. 1_MG-2023 TaxID=3062626 RepID=UPI0026E3135F|nr:hypothetical protein [Zobellia sp. 1_MG-2023]MDO6819808.1 hypothetical protein [Zobellia sp. 1_MG-2023]